MTTTRPSMESIIALVSKHTGVSIADLKSPSRKEKIAYARFIVMHLGQRASWHNETIAFSVGRKRSSACNGVKSLADRRSVDNTMDALVRTLEKELAAL